MLKLPRTTLLPDQGIAIEQLFESDVRPVSERIPTVVSYLPFEPKLRDALTVVARTGCLSQGLESIATLLAAEKKGLDEVQRRTATPPPQRMSRLLLVSNDGSERFYRQVASLITEHNNRLWGVRLDVSSEVLSGVLGARANPAKALLIHDKKALSSFLIELCR